MNDAEFKDRIVQVSEAMIDLREAAIAYSQSPNPNATAVLLIAANAYATAHAEFELAHTG